MSVAAATSPMHPFSPEDNMSLRGFIWKESWGIARKYMVLFALLGFTYYYAPSRIKLRNVEPEDIQLAFNIFFAFFSLSLIGFLFKEYWSLIRPLQQELKLSQKLHFTFNAHKYHDPVFKRCLLFYPGKEDVYICIDQASFDKIEEGEPLYLEVTPLTGKILLLRSDHFQVREAEEYHFQ